MSRNITLTVLDPTGKRVCDLYDSGCQFEGQAKDLTVDYAQGELTELTFSLPLYIEDTEGKQIENHRWDYIRNEYKILYNDDGEEDVFNIKIPEEDSRGIGTSKKVTCLHRAEHLKRRGITANYTGEIGNAEYHARRALEGTGWTLGEAEVFYEEDIYDKYITVTEKLQHVPNDMAYGAYAEVRGASGKSTWDNKVGWINTHIKITSCGKNVCDGMIEKGGLHEIDGTPAYSDSSSRYRSINYMYVKPYRGKTLRLTGINTGYAIWHLFNDAKERIGYSYGEEYVIIPSSCSYIKYELLANEAGTANFISPPTEIQIEMVPAGETTTDYEKYAAPYSIEFTLGEYDRVCRNKIERYTVYNNENHTVSKGELQGTEELSLYSVKLYEGGYIYAEIDGGSTDGVTMAYTVTDAESGEPREKYRSVNKEQGISAYDQLKDVAEIFGGKLKFNGLTKRVSIKKTIGRDTKVSFKAGYNMSSIKRKRSTTEIMTRLYVINQTSQNGYIGIEDVNPMGTNFLLDFSYYRDLGLLTKEHENAINQFTQETADTAAQKKAAYDLYTFYSNSLNNMVGRTPMGMAEVAHINGNDVQIGASLFYDGGSEPRSGETIYIRKSTGEWDKSEVSEFKHGTRTITLVEKPENGTTVWWMSRPAAGIIGARIIILDTKRETLKNHEARINQLNSLLANENLNEDEKSDVQSEITELETEKQLLQEEINELNNGSVTVVGLNQYFAQLVKEIGEYSNTNEIINAIEITRGASLKVFEEAMGEMLHDGVFPNGDYAAGQELALYEDAMEYLHENALPRAEYDIAGVDRSDYDDEFKKERLRLGDIVYIDDPELQMRGVNAEVTRYTDKPMSEKTNSFTISNFKEKPVELFEMIIKSSETLETNKKKYDTAAAIIEGDGTINSELIRSSIAKSGVTNDMDFSGNQSVANIVVSQLTTQNLNNAGINWTNVGNLNAEVAVIAQASIKNASIDAAQIRDLTAEQIKAGYLSADRIEAGSITAEKISSYTITADNSIIGAGVIGTAQIADGSITEAKIVSLNADVIQTGTLSADRLILKGDDGLYYKINATSAGLTQTQLSEDQYRNYINGTVIVARSITAKQIAAQTITSNEILAGTITAAQIAANTITADKINVDDLFASKATIQHLQTADISNNESLKLAVGKVRVGGTQLITATKDYSDGWNLWNCETYRNASAAWPEHVRLRQNMSGLSEEWRSSARTPLIRLPDDWQGRELVLSAYLSAAAWANVDRGITWTLCLSNGSTTRGYIYSKYNVVVPGEAKWGADMQYDRQPVAGELVRAWTVYAMDAANFAKQADTTYALTDCTHMFIQFWLRKNGDVRTVAPKLEWGNKPTDWSYAPEDVDSKEANLQSQIDLIPGQITAKVSEVSKDVDALGNRVTSAESTLKLKADSSELSTVKTTVNSLGTRVTEAETSLKLKADQATLSSTANNLQSQINAMPDKIELAVKGIDVGGSQLIKDTQQLTAGTDVDRWRLSSSQIIAVEDGFNAIRFNRTGLTENGWTVAMSPLTQLQDGWANRELTLSAWVYSPNWAAVDANVIWMLALSPGTNAWPVYWSKVMNVPGKVELNSAATSNVPLANNKWVRVSMKFQMSSTSFAGGGVFADQTHLHIQFRLNKNGDVRIYAPKLEFGNKATDWSPNPEEFRAGSNVLITKDEVKISTSEFNVDIVGADGETNMLSIDENGAQMQNLTASNVTPRYAGPATIDVNPAATPAQIASGSHYRSLADALAALSNRWINRHITIRLAKGITEYGRCQIAGTAGLGTITIQGDSTSPPKIVGGVDIYYAGNVVILQYIKIDAAANAVAIDCAGRQTMVIAENCLLTGSGTSSTTTNGHYGLRSWRGASVDIHNSEIYDFYRSVYAQQTGVVQIWGCKGNCTIGANMGTIYVTGSAPCHSKTWEAAIWGGAIHTSEVVVDQGSKPSNVTPASTTIPVNANATRSYSTAWRQNDTEIRQGYYSGVGEWAGCMWFPTSSFSGKTIKSASLTLTRQKGSGKGSSVVLTLYGITVASASGNPHTNKVSYDALGTIDNGETKTFTLPLKAAQALASGTIKGFMLYANDGSTMSGKAYSTNYCKITAPKLNVTF